MSINKQSVPGEVNLYYAHDDWSPDPDISCALPDMRPLALTLIGAAIVMAAVVIAAVKRARCLSRSLTI